MVSTIVILNKCDCIITGFDGSVVLKYICVVRLNSSGAIFLGLSLLFFGLLETCLSVSEVALCLLTLWPPFREIRGSLIAISLSLVDVCLVGGERGVTLISLVGHVYVGLILFCLDVSGEIIDHADDYINSTF